ncbi:glycosyltransferase [Flavobacterium sp. KMS]|uniref:glycosyltransferase n=1 Tax=Flavobacterium sp. KMS TaxID=1566023 RepID=UPI00068CE7FF|nr:glycosyltransferase [Flavobacterium sp. KMS]
MEQNNTPLLTVICTSYNHEKYIKECLDGFVIQQTNFLFEIIVHDDASTDRTVEIVKDYEIKYPSLFFNIYQSENQFTNKEVNIWYDFMLPKARGKYIAICEGDDYWTDPFKLQKQVDFLETNPDFGLCHTNYDRYFQNTRKQVSQNLKFPIKDVFEGLLKSQYPIGTLTVVFRTAIWQEYIREINPVSKDWLMGDLPFWFYLSRLHNVYYLDEVTATYRVLEESASHTRQIDKMIQFDKSTREIKLFFLEKYKSKSISSKKSMREIETIFIYRKIIAFAQCKGNLTNFFSLIFQFHKINKNPKFFLGSFKQIFVRLF